MISETKKELSEVKKELFELLRVDPFNYAEYAEREEDMKALELGLKKAQTFLKEKF